MPFPLVSMHPRTNVGWERRVCCPSAASMAEGLMLDLVAWMLVLVFETVPLRATWPSIRCREARLFVQLMLHKEADLPRGLAGAG